MRHFSRFPHIFLAVAGLALAAVSLSANETRPQLLFLGGSSGSHQTAAMANLLIPVLTDAGFQIKYTEDVTALQKANLDNFDAVILFRDHGDLPADVESDLVSAIEQGKGLIAIHCASHCFRNSERYTRLIGGRFATHEFGEFRTRILDAQHPAMAGLEAFDTTDETYVHNELAEDNQVLMAREDAGRYEPYTWTRQQGKGRVYYTALGHDERTWRQPAFHQLIEKGIRWSLGQLPDPAPPIVVKEDKPLPFSPDDSMKHMHLPQGFRVELFAAEPDITKPIAMTFDARGRLWILESVDYPNDILPEGQGNDRIKICEDTDRDGKADKFTIFAEKLNIPTSLLCYKDGVLVADAPEILFFRDTDGDDRADERQVVFDGFGNRDTHATHANFRYGLDNWIWATIGYSGAKIKIGDRTQVFGAGVFRFRPDGTDLEYLAPTQSNTWGLGFSSVGDVFVSKANDDHALHFAIANRFYEGVRGWFGVGIASIADHKHFHAIASDIRQVDWHGGYTAAAGCTVITGDRFPPEYRERAALVCEPTGHLVHIDFLEPAGSSFVARDGFNLLASTDPWTAPIETQMGPDGVIWMIDWYNYIVRHNPTPPGFETGIGNAYITPDRDHTHGRIYRIVHQEPPASIIALDHLPSAELLAHLGSPNQFIRVTAQRLLVERGDQEVIPKLAAITADEESGLAAMHALWTLEGLGAFASGPSQQVLSAAIGHPNAGTRRTALAIAATCKLAPSELLKKGSLKDPDPHVRLAARLALAEMPEIPAAVGQLLDGLGKDSSDRWMTAATIAALAPSAESFLDAAAKQPGKTSNKEIEAIRVLAGHYARGEETGTVTSLLKALTSAEPEVAAAALEGLDHGWPTNRIPADRTAWEADLAILLDRLPLRDGQFAISLARKWQASDEFTSRLTERKARWLERVRQEDLSEVERLEAAEQVIALASDKSSLEAVIGTVSPRVSPEYARGLIESLAKSKSPDVADVMLGYWARLTPEPRRAAIATLLTRNAWSKRLVEKLSDGSIERSDLSIDQMQRLLRHRDKEIASSAARILEASGAVAESNRQAVLDRLLPLAEKQGDAHRGREVFEKNCAKCHRHGSLGQSIGPDLTGVAARKRGEILADVLDPNRSVEGNFRQYTVATADGRVLTGLLLAESKTAVELLDSEAKKHVVLREDIDEMVGSKLSVMPEGFEKLPEEDLVSLLDFLTTRGKYLPLPIGKAATIVSTVGMFYSKEAPEQRLIFDTWGPKEVFGVPFQLIDPRNDQIPNAILLHSPQGEITQEMPKSVRVECNSPAKAIHLLSGVSGWGFPATGPGSVSMIIRLKYQDGGSEEHPLINGRHFADYIRVVDVPDSKLAYELRGRQLRYLVVTPQRGDVIQEIELVKGTDISAPVVMAITVESP